MNTQKRVLSYTLQCFNSFKQKSFCKLSSDYRIAKEISKCLLNGKPVVALESTLITHGLPYPENLKCAIKLEDIVRQNKAVPATIGVLNGTVHIGMNQEKLEMLASKKEKMIKISRRDLPYIMSKGLSGGTTVAATIALAHRAKIPVFVTGGIGGVHRGATTSMDISADLYELSRTPMAVVSSGVKSILDIGLTLEYLETLGVCVATFGCSREFPSFFTPRSKFMSICNVESYAEAAKLIDSRDRLLLESGILIAVPIPQPHYEDGLLTDAVIEEALQIAKDKHVTGKDVTPFVLKRVQELSGGASLRANIGLLENNAHVGSQIAVELSSLKKQRHTEGLTSSRVLLSPVKHEATKVITADKKPVVIGGSNLDIQVKTLEDIKIDGRTINGEVQSVAGGVARNVADCLTRLKAEPLFISVVGEDANTEALLNKMKHMNTKGVKRMENFRTATCIVLLDRNGECLFVVGDFGVHGSLLPDQVKSHEDEISAASLLVMDSNIPISTMDFIFSVCSKHQVPVWFEPTDISKASRPFACSSWRRAISYASPNLKELKVMHEAILGERVTLATGTSVDDALKDGLRLGVPLLKNDLHTLVVTLGAHGVLLITNLSSTSHFPASQALLSKSEVRAVHFPAPQSGNIVSVSGAGDCLVAGMVAGILRGLNHNTCVEASQRAALLSLGSHNAVPDSMCPEDVFRSNPEGPLLRCLNLR